MISLAAHQHGGADSHGKINSGSCFRGFCDNGAEDASNADYFEQMEAHLRFDLEMEVLDLESCLGEAGEALIGRAEAPKNAAPVQKEEERAPLSLRQELAKARRIKSVSSRPGKQARRRSSVRIFQPCSSRQRRSQRLVECARKGAEVSVACKERMHEEKDGDDENGGHSVCVENPVEKIVEKNRPDKEEMLEVVDDDAKAERKRPSGSVHDRLREKMSAEDKNVEAAGTSSGREEDLASVKLERRRLRGRKAAPAKAKRQRVTSPAMDRPSEPENDFDKVTGKGLAGITEAEKRGPKSNGSVDNDPAKDLEEPVSTPMSKESNEKEPPQRKEMEDVSKGLKCIESSWEACLPLEKDNCGVTENKMLAPSTRETNAHIQQQRTPSRALEAVAVTDGVVSVVTKNKTLAPSATETSARIQHHLVAVENNVVVVFDNILAPSTMDTNAQIPQQRAPSPTKRGTQVRRRPAPRTDRTKVENARKSKEDNGDRNVELLPAPVDEPKPLQPQRRARRRDRSCEAAKAEIETERRVKKPRKNLEADSSVEETKLEARSRIRTRSATKLQVSTLVISLDEDDDSKAAAGNQLAVIAIDATGRGSSSQLSRRRINTRSSPQVAMLALEHQPGRASQEMVKKKNLCGGEANRGTRIVRKRGVPVDDI